MESVHVLEEGQGGREEMERLTIRQSEELSTHLGSRCDG